MSKKKRDVYCVDNMEISENAHGKFLGDKKSGDQLYVFAKIFNCLLEEKGIDQEKLAADLNISAGLISNYRNGKTEPGLTKIINIAKYLNVDCTYLMTGVSPANRTLAADTGLSHNAIEFLKFINKKGNSEELRTITMINRALDFKPSDLKEKSGPFISIFAFLDQYVTSGDVEWKLRDEYGQGDNESPAKTQRALGIDDIERRIVYVKFDKTLERMELGKLYRESRITALKQGLDELYEAENKRKNPKEKKLPC